MRKSTLNRKTEYTLVGSGAVRCNLNRGGPCEVLSLPDGEQIIVDLGRNAVHNLTECGFTVEAINTVFITHLHFDHVCDLPYFVLLSWNNGRERPLRFFGPEGLGDYLRFSIREAYTEDIESRLAHGKDPLGIEWEVTPITGDGEFLKTGSCTLSALETPHGSMDSLNLRVDSPEKRVVITGDTRPDERLVSFAEEADLLAVECSGTRSFLDGVPWGEWHMCPEAVADLAAKAGAKRTVLKHLVMDDWSEDPDVGEQLEAKVRTGCDSDVTAGYDGLKVSV